MNTVLITVVVAFCLAFLLGILLGVFKKIFAVPVNETQQAVRDALPSANCGGCGFPGCDGYAAAVAAGTAEPNLCTPGGAEVASLLAKILGKEVSIERKVVVLRCKGTKECAKERGVPLGITTCHEAVQIVNGTKTCSFGCVGLADCCGVCEFDALHMGDDGIPHVDRDACTGCGACMRICPKNLFQLVPFASKAAMALCQNRSDNRPMILKNCKVGCITCGKCEKACDEIAQAIKITNEIPEVDDTKCTSCGKCVEVCPTHVFKLLPAS